MAGDPDDYRTSTFARFNPSPGSMQLPNPLSPLEGDEIFFAYMIPGASFQARDGSQWGILDYPWAGLYSHRQPLVSAASGAGDHRQFTKSR